MKTKIIKDKMFYISFLSIVIPIVFQDLLSNGLNLIDNIMVGKLSEIEIAAVSFANQPFFIFNVAVAGLASGATVIITQYHGKKDLRSVYKVVAIVRAFVLSLSPQKQHRNNISCCGVFQLLRQQ